MFGLSFWELALILVVALLAVGPRRLPELLRLLGQGMRTLREATSDVRSAIEEPLNEVRRPLDDMKEDLSSAVQQFQGEIDRELNQDKLLDPSKTLPESAQPNEIENPKDPSPLTKDDALNGR